MGSSCCFSILQAACKHLKVTDDGVYKTVVAEMGGGTPLRQGFLWKGLGNPDVPPPLSGTIPSYSVSWEYPAHCTLSAGVNHRTFWSGQQRASAVSTLFPSLQDLLGVGRFGVLGVWRLK
jgi:hypothetical protein